jgi:fimbrial chaperone protein
MLSSNSSYFVKRIFLVALCVCSLLISTPTPVEAGTWRVAPIKLYFDAKTRSDVITVTNDGEQPLTLEITAMSWTQDANGKDTYQPATDLIFFPKQLTVESKKERVIRTGIKVPAIDKEKAYRLFIREVPAKQQSGSNTVAIAIQFGVPIFVKPHEENTKGAINNAMIADGTFTTKVVNQGNSHFRINTIALQGTSANGEVVYSKEINGWYLLSGNSQTFTTTIPPEICQQLSSLDIQVNADRIKLNGKIDVSKAMCSAP